MKKTLGKLAPILLAAALLFGACAPAVQTAPTTERAHNKAEADIRWNTEIAAPEAEEPAAMAETDAPGQAGLFPASMELRSAVAVPEIAAVPVTNIADAVTPLAASGGSMSDINLTIPSTFQVTRPTEKITTTYSSYFITGTSDPNLSLTIGGNAISRNGSKGTWGVLVNLSAGTNTFTIRQGDRSETVTIVRSAGGTATISEIRQSSMYPSTQGGVKTGDSMLVECVAPAGGTVTASFEGRSVTLQQVATANTGTPATYRGSLLVQGDYPTGETTRIGKVTYTLTYGGTTKSFQSTGEMYVAGVGSRIAVRVTDSLGAVYNSTSQLGVFRERLKRGATDYVAGEDNSYYQLASGGYLPKSQAEIITGTVSIQNSLSAVNFASTAKKETFTFRGNNATAFVTSIKDNVFYLTIYNTSGTPAVDTSGSRLFSQAGVTDNGGSVTYTFPFKNGGLFNGYNLSFDGNNLVLRFQYKPTINAASATPLDGVIVMLDPGHGGDDTGAPGVAAGLGPNEADLNLAHAFATRDALRAMGATVYLTRTDSTKLELHERLELFENCEADLFISIHHNSLAENTDANRVTGTEVYYHTSISKTLASSMLNSVSSSLGRTARHYRQDYYRVTVLPNSPSILLELGFISNPVEYERSADPANIQKAAQAIADGVVNSLR